VGTAGSLLAATPSYFEMIGKILNPASNGWRTSREDLNHGFCDVYPAFSTSGADRSDRALPTVAQIRDGVRNGRYHLGYTKGHLFIHHQPQRWPNDFNLVIDQDGRFYLVNPHNMRA
jgi:hypothetical protein